MKTVYKVDTVIDFVRDYGNLIESFKVTSSKRIAFDEWQGDTYWVNVKFNMVNGYKNKLVTIETNSSWMDWVSDDDFEDETIDAAIERTIEANWFTATI